LPPLSSPASRLPVPRFAEAYLNLYVLNFAGADSLSVILCAAVAFASPSLAYIRLPDTVLVWG